MHSAFCADWDMRNGPIGGSAKMALALSFALIAAISFSYNTFTQLRFLFIEPCRYCPVIGAGGPGGSPVVKLKRRNAMKVWTKPAVREQEVGLEVTSYLPAEIDII
jgi:coenzyme PQQ precursor peptide PqqA